MPRNLRANERTELDKIKADIIAGKTRLRRAVAGLNDWVDTHHEAGDLAEEAAAMAMRGAVLQALGALDLGHAQAMRDMLALFDDGGVVIQGGGGGR